MNLVSKSSQTRARNSISRLTTKYNLPDIYISMWKSFKSFLMFYIYIYMQEEYKNSESWSYKNVNSNTYLPYSQSS